MSLGIGSKVWVLDPFRRVYRKDETGKLFGSPLPEGFFVETTIVSETPRKWVTQGGREASKKRPFETGFWTREMVDEKVWRETHRFRILTHVSDVILKLSNAQLRAIGEIAGYDFSNSGEQ